MVSQTIKELEKPLAKLYEVPIEEILGDLQTVANRYPDHAGPHLTIVLTSAMSRHDAKNIGKNHLDKAKHIINSGGRNDAESKFMESLFNVLKMEYDIALNCRPSQVQHFDETKLMDLALKEIEIIRGLQQIGTFLPKAKGSKLPHIIFAALRTLSKVSGTKTRDFRLGISMLSRVFRSNDELKYFSGYFLMQGYRRAGRIRQALDIGSQIQRKYPRNAMILSFMGNLHLIAGNKREAERDFKNAISLDPTTPGHYLSYSRVLKNMRKIDEANDMLRKVQELDRRNLFARKIKDLKTQINIAERIIPQLKELGVIR